MRENQERYSWLISLAWVASIMALAFILRAIYGGAREILIDHDSAGYIMRAREIFAGGPLFDTIHMPGYPLLIGLWASVLGDYIHAAKTASIVSGSLLAGVAYLLGKRLYGQAVGITAALLIAINVALITVSSWELTEATYSLAVFSAVGITVWAVDRQDLWIWALAGFLYGICYWVRPEGFFYLGIIPFLSFVEHWFQIEKAFSKSLVLRMTVFLVAASLLVVPNVIHIYRETGAWTISGKTVFAALFHSTELEGRLAKEKAIYGLTPDKQSTMREGGFGRVSMFANFSKNLGFKARMMIKNWWKTYKLFPSVFPTVLILFMGIGLFNLKWTFRDRWAEFYLLGALLPWVAIYPLYEIDFENLTPVVPILMLWASLGIVEVAKRIVSAGKSYWPYILQKPAVTITSTIMLVAALEFSAYARPLLQADYYQKLEDDVVNRRVAEWVKGNLPDDVKIMARKAFIPAYANRKWIRLPYADYQDVIDYARLKEVDVVIMDEKFKVLRPQLVFLFEQPGPLEELSPIFTTQNERGQKIILYKVLPGKGNTASDQRLSPLGEKQLTKVRQHVPLLK